MALLHRENPVLSVWFLVKQTNNYRCITINKPEQVVKIANDMSILYRDIFNSAFWIVIQYLWNVLSIIKNFCTKTNLYKLLNCIQRKMQLLFFYCCNGSIIRSTYVSPNYTNYSRLMCPLLWCIRCKGQSYLHFLYANEYINH